MYWSDVGGKLLIYIPVWLTACSGVRTTTTPCQKAGNYRQEVSHLPKTTYRGSCSPSHAKRGSFLGATRSSYIVISIHRLSCALLLCPTLSNKSYLSYSPFQPCTRYILLHTLSMSSTEEAAQVAGILLIVLDIITVAGRFYSRWITKLGFKWDDWTILIALLAGILTGILTLWGTLFSFVSPLRNPPSRIRFNIAKATELTHH
jgi:hypothetical protein